MVSRPVDVVPQESAIVTNADMLRDVDDDDIILLNSSTSLKAKPGDQFYIKGLHKTLAMVNLDKAINDFESTISNLF